MTWNNRFLMKAKNLDAEHFTTDKGIELRKKAYPLLNAIIKRANGKKVYLVSYPKLEEGENYIFAAGHSFPGDIGSNLSVIDRPTYTLIGTTDQVDHNPQMNFLWANGMIYVNKLSPESRKESYRKMVRVLNAGSSVMLFPEGVLNNTENLNCGHLYPGFYHLSQETGKKIVPIVANYNIEDNTVFVAAGNPIQAEGRSKEEVKMELRDTLATLRFNLSRMTTKQAKALKRVMTPEEFLRFNPELNVELRRETLTGDIHQKYLELRKKVYNEVKWNDGNCWEEEIMYYKEHGITDFEEVFSFIDNIDLENADPRTLYILRPLIEEKRRREKYNVKRYMKRNWNK